MLRMESRDVRTVAWGFLALMVLITVLLRAPILSYGMPFDLGDEDENGFIGCALNYGASKTLKPILTWYPAFYTYLLATTYGAFYLASLAFGHVNNTVDFAVMYLTHPGKFHFIGRVLSMLLSVGCLILMYACGKKYKDEMTGIIAAGLFTFSVTVLMRTSWALPDTATC